MCEWTAKRVRLWSGAAAAVAARFLARLQVSPRRCQPCLWVVFKILTSDKVGELVDLWVYHLKHLYYFNWFGFWFILPQSFLRQSEERQFKTFSQMWFFSPSIYPSIHPFFSLFRDFQRFYFFASCLKEQSRGLSLINSGVTFGWVGDSSLNILQYNADAFQKNLHLISYSFSP